MQLTYRIIKWIPQLTWNSHPQAHHYKVMAMSQTFAYSVITITSELECDLNVNKDSPYIRYKIIAESKDGIKLEESNEIEISCSDTEKFEITALNGYNGTSLVFRSEWVYDLYKVYDNNTLIAETEDPILELWYKITKIKLNGITVEWYTKVNNNYILWWVSESIAKLPERKKSDYKISVVIPVYNAQTFLPRTVDSILSSSMSDIEIILVDDGSTDNSLKICKWYAKNFPCVSIVQQENQRVAVARNTWMMVAKGEYLWFVGNDDIVHPFMYEKLYNASKLKGTDIAIAPTVIRNNINDKEICLGMPGKKEKIIVYTYDELIHNIGNRDNMYFVAVWNKIVKTEVAKQVKFPTEYPNKIVLYEDSAYTPTLYSYIDNFAICKDAYYIWDKRKQKTVWTASTMHKNEDTNNVWKSFIYAYSYPIYNRCDKNRELCEYACFKRLIESYDKFKTPSLLLDYWNEKLRELINSQKLYENHLIMENDHLREVIEKLTDMATR